ncbi:MAG: insulinase family protein, partial [Anaeroplasmataceae bacterium]|nr:insulinase family protein [Anaeroplasmataceae bacterium]
CVDQLYIKKNKYTIEALMQAFEELTIPYMHSKQADSKLFLRAFEIYQSDLYSYNDDYEMLAFEKAVQSFFEGTSKDFSKMGTETQLKEISLEDLYQYYIKVQKEEEITMITGNVPLIALNEKQKITPKENFQFKERKNIKNTIHHPLTTKQCYLEVIFDHQIFADDPLYASMIVLNYIFGGGQFSRLFCDVREKLGLCYSISSSYLVTSGILVVSCSTEKQKIEQVLTSINQVFESLLENISLKEVKESILALKTEEQDYIETAIYTYLTKHYFLDYLSIEEEIEAIQKVSLTTLKKAYQKIKCSLVYTLGGDADV